MLHAPRPTPHASPGVFFRAAALALAGGPELGQARGSSGAVGQVVIAVPLLAVIAGEVFRTAEIVAILALAGQILVLHPLFPSSSIRRGRPSSPRRSGGARPRRWSK